MFRSLPITITLVCLALFLNPIISRTDAESIMSSSQQLFTKNMGQWDSRVLFRTSAPGAVVWIANDGIYYQFLRRVDSPTMMDTGNFDRLSHFKNRDSFTTIEQIVVKASFVGANVRTVATGKGEADFHCNYFFGDNPDEWHSEVPNYVSVQIEGVYPGIDLVSYRDKSGDLEYDFKVGPGSNYRAIRIRYDGARSISINKHGELEIETPWHVFTESRPEIYQEIDGERTVVSGGFKIEDQSFVSFELAKEYDPSLPLTIDPKLEFSTYLGGTSYDEAQDIAVDQTGSVYVTGRTYSTDFPQVNPLPVMSGPSHVFVTKLSPSGSAFMYSTFIGGGEVEDATGISVDNLGRAYVCGETSSNDFPKYNNFLPLSAAYNAFVFRLAPEGDSLEFSTYLGGTTGGGGATDIKVDNANCAYVCGATYSANFPTVSAFQPNLAAPNSVDAFAVKMNSQGSGLIFGTYLGGTDFDVAGSLAVTNSGRVVLSGYTTSADFPRKKAIPSTLPHHFEGHAFVSEVCASGDSLVYSSMLGGTADDAAFGVAVDEMGCAYVVGRTNSSDFPTKNQFLPIVPGDNGFVSKMSPDGDSLMFSSYLGGAPHYTQAFEVAVTGGTAVVVGETNSLNFPLTNPYQAQCLSQDGFVLRFSPDCDNLIYSTYLGGHGYERLFGVTADSLGAVYVAGVTTSLDFPLLNEALPSQGQFDAFVAKLTDEFLCGDIDASEEIVLTDIVYFINYIFSNGPQPNPIVAADIDCNALVTVSDVVYLIKYVFSGGPAPCAACP